jgi:hypothetical protein
MKKSENSNGDNFCDSEPNSEIPIAVLMKSKGRSPQIEFKVDY